MMRFVDEFVREEWDGIGYAIGERVYALFDGEWYVAIVLGVVQNAAGLERDGVSPDEDEKHHDTASAIVKHEHNADHSCSVDDQSSSTNMANAVYHVKFTGYGNEAHLKKEHIKPYLDIPSEYLKLKSKVHAVFYEDAQLYEGVIDTYLADTNSVVVKFVGYGNKQDTELKDLRVLTDAAKEEWYKFEEYTLEKAQEELKEDVAERQAMWEQSATHVLEPEYREEILTSLNKEARGELAPKEAQQEYTSEQAAQNAMVSQPPPPNKTKAPSSTESATSNEKSNSKRRGGKRKREEMQAQESQNQWNNWQKKFKKRKGDLAEKAAKKSSKMSETLNQIQEAPVHAPAGQRNDSRTAGDGNQHPPGGAPGYMPGMPPPHMAPPYGAYMMPPPYFMYGPPPGAPPYAPQGPYRHPPRAGGRGRGRGHGGQYSGRGRGR